MNFLTKIKRLKMLPDLFCYMSGNVKGIQATHCTASSVVRISIIHIWCYIKKQLYIFCFSALYTNTQRLSLTIMRWYKIFVYTYSNNNTSKV